MKCKPDYEYFGDGHVMCKTNCPKAMQFLFASSRTGEQVQFKGCPPMLNCFYLREIWLRNLGIQKVQEQTRNLILINTSKSAFREAKERIIAGRNSLKQLEQAPTEKDKLPQNEEEKDNG